MTPQHALSLQAVTDWLVTNGYSKADGKKTKQGGFLFEGRSQRHWAFNEFTNGVRVLTIHPEGNAVPGHSDSFFSDMSISMEVDDDGRVKAPYVGQSYSGSVLSIANRPPCNTADLAQAIEESREVFVRFLDAMVAEEDKKTDAEIRQELQQFFLQNPNALDFFCSAELLDEEEDQ